MDDAMKKCTASDGRFSIDPVFWGVIGCESMAILGIFAPVMHGIAGFFNLHLAAQESVPQNLDLFIYLENSIAWFVEPLLFFSVLLTATGFYALGKKYPDQSVRPVMSSLGFFAFTRLLMSTAAALSAGAMADYAGGAPGMLPGLAALKGFFALLAATGGVLAAFLIYRYFLKFRNANTLRVGGAGAQVIIWSVFAGVVFKTASIYAWPYAMTNLFFAAMVTKSIGLSMIALQMYQLGGKS